MSTTVTTTAAALVRGIDPNTNPPFYEGFAALLPTMRKAWKGEQPFPADEIAVIAALQAAIDDNERVLIVYSTPASERGEAHTKMRFLKRISHIYAVEGGVCVVAHDTPIVWSGEAKAFVQEPHPHTEGPWRTFRTDRILALSYAGAASEHGEYKERVWVYPADFRIRRGTPQQIPLAAIARYAQNGWSLAPVSAILTAPTEAPVEAPVEVQTEVSEEVSQAAYEEKRLDKDRVLAALLEAQQELAAMATLPSGEICKAVTEDGDPCKAHTIAGSRFCVVHHGAWSSRYLAALKGVVFDEDRPAIPHF